MHAGAFDAVDGLDRARQLAFQGAQAVDVLDEGGGAEGVRLVENLIADAGGGQIVLGQRHAQLGHLVGGNQDGAAISLASYFTSMPSSLAVTAAASRDSSPAIEDGLGRFGDRAGDIKEEGGQHGGDAGHHAETRSTNRFEKFGHEQILLASAGKPRPFLLGKHCRLCGKIWLKAEARAYFACAFLRTSCCTNSHHRSIPVPWSRDALPLAGDDRFAVNCDIAARCVARKPGQAETVDGMLPGEKFLHRQRVALAGIVQAEQAAAHGGDDFSLAPDHPAARRRRRQIGERQRRPIGADDIAHASFALFHH